MERFRPANETLWLLIISFKSNDNAFGSSVTDRFDNKKSDIDLLVEIDYSDPLNRGEKLISLWDAFERFFDRKVDLLSDSSIHNPYLRKSIDTTKVLIYDGTSQKVLV